MEEEHSQEVEQLDHLIVGVKGVWKGWLSAQELNKREKQTYVAPLLPAAY